jgi:hypothetical protein
MAAPDFDEMLGHDTRFALALRGIDATPEQVAHVQGVMADLAPLCDDEEEALTHAWAVAVEMVNAAHTGPRWA